eukprot:GHVQ01015650.1.p1 GENE.GHVQ01015650.1~~GHVQ01015650.1.p1  ORF type:complete len:390 (+),score=28.57 GHVQ01015650.1:1561-2730(+)
MLAGFAQVCQGSVDDRIRALFEVFDREQDGRLHFDEVMGVLCLIYKSILTPTMVVDFKTAGVDFDTIDELSLTSTQDLFRQVLYERPPISATTEAKSTAEGRQANLFSPHAQRSGHDVVVPPADKAEELTRKDFIDKLLASGEDSNTCSIDTIDLEGHQRWERDEPDLVPLIENVRLSGIGMPRIHPAQEFNRNEGVRPWRVAHAIQHLYLTYDEFKNACLRTPPAAGFSKATLLRLPLIKILKEILAPPDPMLWNCPVTYSRSTRKRGSRPTADAKEAVSPTVSPTLTKTRRVDGRISDCRQETSGNRSGTGELGHFHHNASSVVDEGARTRYGAGQVVNRQSVSVLSRRFNPVSEYCRGSRFFSARTGLWQQHRVCSGFDLIHFLWS